MKTTTKTYEVFNRVSYDFLPVTFRTGREAVAMVESIGQEADVFVAGSGEPVATFVPGKGTYWYDLAEKLA